MADRFSPARGGNAWVAFCDICGQKYFASELRKLSQYTGRGGLMVCPNDYDEIDYGLIPYKTPTEQNLPWVRVNHTDTTNGSDPIDPETDDIGV